MVAMASLLEARTRGRCRPRAARARRRTGRRARCCRRASATAAALSTAASISALTLVADRLRVDAERLQALDLAVDRVLRAPLLDLLGRDVLHVVVRGVAVHAHRHGLDQRRALAGERALAGDADGLEHRLGIVAVGAHAREAVGGGALDRVDRELLVERRRVRVLVVLEDEDHRQLLHAGPVHRLVEVTARGRAVAEPGDRAARLAAQLERHRHAGRDQHHVGEHRDHPDAALRAVAEVHVAVAAAGDAVLAAHVLGEDPPRLDAADDVRGEVAMQDAQPVLRRPSPTSPRRTPPPGRSRRRSSPAPCPGGRASSRALRCRAS